MTSEVQRAAAHFTDGVAEVRPIGGGLINDTYLVASPTDRFVLQRLNPEVFADPDAVMANIVTVTGVLDGSCTPALRRTHGGDWAVVVEGATWRAWEEIPDTETVAEPTPARVGSAAQLLAGFHDGVAGCDPTSLAVTIPNFHDPLHRLAQLQRAVDADTHERVACAHHEIDAVLGHRDLETVADDLARVDPEVAHNDTKLTNFLFRDDAAVCLLDLDTIMPTARCWDVADLVRSAGTTAAEDDPDPVRHRADAALVEAILTGYGATGSTRERIEVTCVVIAWEQAARFLTDWLQGDRYWKTTSPTQNLDRARGQIALLESLRAMFDR